MGFLYALSLKLLYPTSVALLCAGVAFLVRPPRLRAAWATAAVVTLLVCGNGWVVGSMTRHLEGQFLPRMPVPKADAIVVLSGGILGRTPPRPSVEVGEAGDRLLYGAALYRQGAAPRIVVTGNVATGGVAARPAADDMAELLAILGIPDSAIVTETRSENTHDHAVNLCPVMATMGIHQALLVTSALHMPRAVGVFRRLCPELDVIPAPTDFRAPYQQPMPWYRSSVALLPTPQALVDFSDAAHEYLGLLYYRLRGWL